MEMTSSFESPHTMGSHGHDHHGHDYHGHGHHSHHKPNAGHPGECSGSGADTDDPSHTPASASTPPADDPADDASDAAEDDGEYDLVVVGFGPAALAIAIALHDASLVAGLAAPAPGHPQRRPRVLFLERQPEFSWHAGMLLPGARMQISFLKDLATPRDPTSAFTFTNYLHAHGRLTAFCNLGTLLPLRAEFHDYLCWCARHFAALVRYGTDVLAVAPAPPPGDRGLAGAGPVRAWDVHARHGPGGATARFRARNVVVAVGGQPAFPPGVVAPHPRIVHSAHYTAALSALLAAPGAAGGPRRIAVVGGGQSAAEIFADLHARLAPLPASSTALFIRGAALRPSDDSPFVNEIFDPGARVDALYALPAPVRRTAIRADRATNYSVVRLPLLDELYASLYAQRLATPDERAWPHRIFPLLDVVGVLTEGDGGPVRLRLRHVHTGEESTSPGAAFDAVIFATGYSRDAPLDLLRPVARLLADPPGGGRSGSAGTGVSGVGGSGDGGWCAVTRDYRMVFRPGAVADGTAIFLQGCCEDTHGLSDSLLSILAVRAGELVQSIFSGGNPR